LVFGAVTCAHDGLGNEMRLVARIRSRKKFILSTRKIDR
jgi:hypothetical protein